MNTLNTYLITKQMQVLLMSTIATVLNKLLTMVPIYIYFPHTTA